MKLSTSLLLLICVISSFSCKNNAGGTSSDLTALITADCTKGNQNVQEYQALYDSCFALIKKIKITGSSQGEAGIQKAYPLVQEVLPVFLAHETHKKLTADLEALSGKLGSGQITLPDAKKEYDLLKAELITSGNILATGKATYEKVQTDFLQTFPDAGNQSN